MKMQMNTASSMMTSGMSGAAMSTSMPTATAAAATGMGGMASSMDMDMGGGACKISMLWNWNTIDACFISSTWRITSKGMFAGSCIGVIFVVCALEFLRRLGGEYDRYIAQQVARSKHAAPVSESRHAKEDSIAKADATAHADERSSSGSRDNGDNSLLSDRKRPTQFRPTLLQQSLRAALHMLQFGVAYFIILLAMYYNGYIITASSSAPSR